MRGAALLLVLVFHATVFTMDWPMPSAPMLDQLYHGITSCGWVGVDLFFVLSGFLITRILRHKRTEAKYFRNFYARRSLRIFPLYFGTLTVWTIVTQLKRSHSFGATPWLWTYTSNLLVAWHGWEAVPTSVAHFWSLAIEEQFYLLWPLVVYVASERALLRICCGALVLAEALRVAFIAYGNVDAAHAFPLCRFDSLLVGGAVALLMREQTRPSPQLTAYARRVALVSSACLVALAFARGGSLAFHDPSVQVFGLTPLALLFASLIVLLLARPAATQSARVATVLATVGRYSYGMYVLQQVVFLAVRRVPFPRAVSVSLLGTSQVPIQIAVIAVSIGITFALALVSWNLIEKRAIALKRFFE